MKSARLFLLPLVAGAALMILSACEVEVGNPEADSPSAPAPAGNPAPVANPGSNNPPPGNPPGNNPDPDPDPGTVAPGVPSVQSPGNGESFSGATKVTFVWTDAEHAEQFEVVVQALGTGGWQVAAHKVTDDFEFSYTLNNPDWTQYRWAVRSLAEDGTPSAYTAFRSFTWNP